MNILLHQCCGPCSIYPVRSLKEQMHSVTALFYNPNIHPMKELYLRMEGAAEVCRMEEIPMMVNREYGLIPFTRANAGAEDARCAGCYRVRMRYTAQIAKEHRFDAFTTSLLYSKYQNHEQITAICYEVSQELGIPFHYADYRTGWKYGIEESKLMGIYRQQYCGCIYSETDRYAGQLPSQFQKKYGETVQILGES